MPVTDCGVDISFVELRKVGDKPIVEKAYVFNAARGDEFMKDWQFDPRDARICHRSCLTCGYQDSENRKAEGDRRKAEVQHTPQRRLTFAHKLTGEMR
jgi:Zn ribbon nucleic-acid-binding protein